MWVEARSFISSAIINIDDLVKYDLYVFNLFVTKAFIDSLIQVMSKHVTSLFEPYMMAYSYNILTSTPTLNHCLPNQEKMKSEKMITCLCISQQNLCGLLTLLPFGRNNSTFSLKV